jgi:hypothetical protein
MPDYDDGKIRHVHIGVNYGAFPQTYEDKVMFFFSDSVIFLKLLWSQITNSNDVRACGPFFCLFNRKFKSHPRGSASAVLLLVWPYLASRSRSGSKL